MSYYLRDKELVRAEWKLNRRNILLVGIFAPGGYLLFLFALSLAPVSHMAPMREIGTVFGSIFGIRLLRESGGVRRIVGGILITAGVISLGLFG
jgi:drug/metabolite transporter (DMT)-like permease